MILISAPRFEQFLIAIICPNHIQQVRQTVRVIPTNIGPEQCLRHRACGIVLVADFDEPLQNSLRQFLLGRVLDLVAHTPENYARMIPIAPDDVAQIRLRPLVEV